jgi:3-oxoacyl-[acyl-carrier protein] reductase
MNSQKVALITGGSRGIGKATVERFIKDGYRVALTYGKSAAEAEALSQNLGSKETIRAYKADATQTASLPNVVQSVMQDFGRLDVLVNNAGVFEAGMIGELSAEDYARVFQVNVEAVFVLTNEAVKHLPIGGRIINVSSVLGERAAGAGMSVYNASKFAVSGFTRSWAKDLGNRGILVNAVQPGPIATDMNPEDSDAADWMRSQTALGRYGRPQEIANVIAFLASDDANYITGATLNVDGGWNA